MDDYKLYEAESKRPYIKIEDMKHGYLYRIHARNARYGIWNEEHKSFIISRVKFVDNYLFEEYHWDTGAPYGTARPLEELEKAPTTDVLEYLNKFERR